MYGIYANIWGIWMVHVTIYSSTMDPMGICVSWPHQANASNLEKSNGEIKCENGGDPHYLGFPKLNEQ
jgi:hypothetical protein